MLRSLILQMYHDLVKSLPSTFSQLWTIHAFICQATITHTDKARCKVNGKEDFPQGHDAAVKCHNNIFFWVTTTFLLNKELFSRIGDYWNCISKNPTPTLACRIEVTFNTNKQPWFTSQVQSLDKGLHVTLHSFLYLHFFQGNRTLCPPSHPDKILTPSQSCFAWSLPVHLNFI